MNKTFVKKASMALSLLAVATFAHANTKAVTVLCPPIASIQNAADKLDASQKDNGNGAFITYTSAPAFYDSHLPWYVAVLTDSTSADEAFKIGKETLQNVNAVFQQTAYEIEEGQYACAYQPGQVVALGGNFEFTQVKSFMKR